MKIAECLFRHAAVLQVNRVAPQDAERIWEEFFAALIQFEVGRIAHDIEKDGLVGRVIGVDHMLDEAGLDLQPGDLAAVAFYQTEPGLAAVLPADRNPETLLQHGKIIGDIRIHKDAVGFGDRHVMHHGGRRDGDFHIDRRRPAAVDHAIAQPGFVPVGAKGHQFPRYRVTLGMRGHAAGESPEGI